MGDDRNTADHCCQQYADLSGLTIEEVARVGSCGCMQAKAEVAALRERADYLNTAFNAKCEQVAAFQRDKERYLSVQRSVDEKQRRLKEEVRSLQRSNDALRAELEAERLATKLACGECVDLRAELEAKHAPWAGERDVEFCPRVQCQGAAKRLRAELAGAQQRHTELVDKYGHELAVADAERDAMRTDLEVADEHVRSLVGERDAFRAAQQETKQ